MSREKLANILRLLLSLFAAAGILDTALMSSDGFMNAQAFSYYTIQSNILALAVTASALLLALFRVREPRWFSLLRFVTAVAISVTFLVFWTMLAPNMPVDYLLTMQNLTLHTLVPVMAVCDYIFFDPARLPGKRQVWLCTLPPLCYFGFAMLRAEIAPPFSGGSRFPYWFLDVDKYGWFNVRNGLGVFYWVLVVIALVLALGYGIRRAKKAVPVRRRIEEEREL